MAINVIVNGAQGRMGQHTVKVLEADQELQLVAQLGKQDNLAETIANTHAQIVVDFTTPTAVYENTKTIINAKARPVIGTTGLTEDQIKTLQQHCQQQHIGGVIAPNFSVGAVLMMKYAQNAIQYLPHAEIIELHHEKKLDAPSGTAIKTAAMMAANRKDDHDITIHSVRLPGIVADQHVIFGGHGETLTIQHHTINRECFMPGVILACKKVMTLNELVYGMENIL